MGRPSMTPREGNPRVERHSVWAHRVVVGEDEQSSGVRRHDDHDQAPPRNRCLAGAMSVVTVPVAVGRDLLGQNRFRTV